MRFNVCSVKHVNALLRCSLGVTTVTILRSLLRLALVDYTSVKEKLIQSWRYKTLAVIKRHKNHLSFFFISRTELFQ